MAFVMICDVWKSKKMLTSKIIKASWLFTVKFRFSDACELSIDGYWTE